MFEMAIGATQKAGTVGLSTGVGMGRMVSLQKINFALMVSKPNSESHYEYIYNR